MLMRTPRQETERGMTVVEVTIVMAILALVTAMIFGLLVSLTNNERRTQALVANEQEVRFVIGEILRDLRAADPFNTYAYPNKATYESHARLELKDPSTGTTTHVRWIYETDPASASYLTLSRQIMSSNAASATVQSSTVKLRRVRNVQRSPSIPLFQYFSQSGKDLIVGPYSSEDVGDCAIRVKVTISADSNPGPEPFTETADAHLRNRFPGGLGCV